jgi:N-acetylglucosamine kinase-like BadF-type ATPase
MTRAIITNREHQVLGEGTAGPSNPLRVGVSSAAAAVREAFDKACDAGRVQRSEVVAAEIGLAGVRRADVRVSMYNALKGLGIAEMEVVTDADIALFGATNGEPGVVIIAGTGSVCCGRNARRKLVWAGGWGPLAGDEGSGSWIARRALQAIARAYDGRGPATSLVQSACAYFNLTQPEDLSMAIYSPSMTNDRIAGFGKQVADAAQEGDAVASEIILDAGHELGIAAAAVIRGLDMERERFQVAYVGGVFKVGDLLLDPLRQEIASLAPEAYLAAPLINPVVAAARMARTHLEQNVLAV